MGFLGIGAMEALVIVVIALIIFGPGRLPEIMGEAGRMLRDFRKITRELTGDFEESISEVRGTYRELEGEMRETATGLRRDAQSMADEVNTAVADASHLDDSPRTARRSRPAAKLDQMVDPQAGEAAARPRSRAGERNVEPPTPQRSTTLANSPNGSTGTADDLLSLSDGDDLLAMDDGK